MTLEEKVGEMTQLDITAVTAVPLPPCGTVCGVVPEMVPFGPAM